MKHLKNKKTGNQKGFSLIEFAVAMVISGILVVGISAFSIQSVSESRRSYYLTQITQQLENTGFWISRDIQMSQNVTLGPDAGFPLQVAWKDIYGKNYTVEFSIDGNQIHRNLSENGSPLSQTLLAQTIDPSAALTNCTSSNGLLTVNLTATLGGCSLSRTYQVKKRPGDF
jgi:prepilin-type N-terminal cleavage/methylation domain-containing protein